MKEDQDQTFQVIEVNESNKTTLSEDHLWHIIDSHLKQHSLVQQQIDSYDEFLTDITHFIQVHGSLNLTIQPQFKIGSTHIKQETWHFKFRQPIKLVMPSHQNADGTNTPTTPMLCRLRDLNYHASLFADLELTKYCDSNGTSLPISQQLFQQIEICKLPVMVGSKLCYTRSMNSLQKTQAQQCSLDHGGYFISDGIQKVLVAQERKIYNSLHIIKGTKNNQPLYCQIKSIGDTARISADIMQIFIKMDRGTLRLICRQNHLSKDVPLGILLRALGLTSDLQISKCLNKTPRQMTDQHIEHAKRIQQLLTGTLEQTFLKTQKQCLIFIGRFLHFNKDKQSEQRCQKEAKQFLSRYLLPHIGVDQADFLQKALFVGYMVKRMLNAYLIGGQETDWQHLGKKRIELSGQLLYNLFTQSFKKNYLPSAARYIKKISNSNQHVQSRIPLVFDSRIITNVLASAVSIGSWGTNGIGDAFRSGVSQTLKRQTSYLATLSHLRKISTPNSSQARTNKQRLLHNTHYGKYCPCQTPQGEKIGLIKHFALLALVSGKIPRKQVQKLIEVIQASEQAIKQQDEIPHSYSNAYKIFVNGHQIAQTTAPFALVTNLKLLRRNGDIHYQTSISWNIEKEQIHIWTDRGRLIRPLLIVENNKILLKPTDITPNITLDELRERGFIQFIDCEEEENTLIAMDQSYLNNHVLIYTHCQIQPSLILGVCASVIPFAHHNQTTKNTLQSAMVKQALSIQSTNTQIRMDATNHQLYYPQRPLASTKPSKHTSASELPFGINTIVAMACFTGYNQEDGIIINKSAVQRGLFRSAFFRTYTAEESIGLYGSSKSTITKPTKQQGIKYEQDYPTIDQDGLPRIGQFYQDDCVVIGKIIIDKKLEACSITEPLAKDCSIKIRRGERCNIQKIMVSQNKHGLKTAKVKTRAIRIPQIGDKFASRHGQKGVCGMLFRQEDLPYTSQGIIPDIIINPHCITSRMTIGHVLECVLAKKAVTNGKFHQDATIFKKYNQKRMQYFLHKAGYNKSGCDPMFNPYSGYQLQNLIFIGPIYYQRLRHLVQDKMFYRTRGQINALTRQPAKGRIRQGGLRFGQMQRDAIISHGLTSFLKQRLFTASDYFRVLICNSCGLMANHHPGGGSAQCRRCRIVKPNSKTFDVAIPYASKLLIQELMSMQIVARLQLKNPR